MTKDWNVGRFSERPLSGKANWTVLQSAPFAARVTPPQSSFASLQALGPIEEVVMGSAPVSVNGLASDICTGIPAPFAIKPRSSLDLSSFR